MDVATRFRLEGSVLRGTLEATPLGFETRVKVDADEPTEAVEDLVRLAEESCYVMQSVRRPVDVRSSILLNGEALS